MPPAERFTEKGTGEKRLCFSVREYRVRLSAVQHQMAIQGVDVLLIHTPENIFYVSGHNTPGYSAYQCLIITASGEPHLLLRNGEIGNAHLFSWLQDFETYPDGSDPVEITGATLDRLGITGKLRIGVELSSWFLTPRVFLGLKAAFPDHEWTDASGAVETCRLIKSEQEIKYISHGVKAAEEGLRAAIEAVEVGKTDNDIAAALHYGMIKAGGEYPAYGPFVALGRRSGIMHSMWGRQIVNSGDALVLEIGGAYHRYHGAIMRTVFVGQPSKQIEKMVEAADAANWAVVNAVAPGVSTADLHGRAAKELERHGFGGSRNGRRCGYGIGIAYWPDWGEGHFLSIIDKPDVTLRSGMTLHLPLSVREPGKVGVAFSETVVVTDSGYEKLTKTERKLFRK